MTSRSIRLARVLAWCCLLLLVAEWLMLRVLGDRAWWTVPLLYGPRWAMAAPALGVVPWLLLEVRLAVLPALAGLAVALFAIMGLEVGVQRASVASGVPFRVLELNADGSNSRLPDIVAELRERHPDLVVLAECNAELAHDLGAVNRYHVRTSVSAALCLLSRGEIVAWEQQDELSGLTRGGSVATVRAVVNTPAGPVRIGLVHLATPRIALDNYFAVSTLFAQGPATRANIVVRDSESATAREWIRAGPDLPTIIAGDFNLPVESAVYRRNWGDLRNAFSRAGLGTGYTKHTRYWGVRIDHVLTSQDIGTHAAHIGNDVGSDHRPLIADLLLPTQRTSTAR